MLVMTAIFLITGAMIATSINFMIKDHHSLNRNDSGSRFAQI